MLERKTVIEARKEYLESLHVKRASSDMCSLCYMPEKVDYLNWEAYNLFRTSSKNKHMLYKVWLKVKIEPILVTGCVCGVSG